MTGPLGARLCRSPDVSRGPIETQLRDTRQAQWEEPATLDLRVVNSSPMLDVGITKKK